MERAFSILILVLLSSLTSIGQIPKPDVQVDGYKGAVKKVVSERADLKRVKDKYVESNRRPEEDIEYDSVGNRYRQLSYDYSAGLLTEIAVYKQIEGEKVVAYDDGDTPGAITGTIMSTGSGISTNQAKWDPRYHFKFKYKADKDGNILEEAWWQSNGDLWLRYVYAYSGNSKTELVFDDDGKIDQKYIYTIDSKGNASEMVIFNVEKDKPAEKVLYTYLSFDSVGNWTKRSVTAGSEDSNFTQRPREVTYRKITYYEGSKP